ncbi:MAG: PilZ domain-containing protein [Gammaproteobacteria bacterium]|nr:PilZ domain-containing protein [Gammaproteobacteria bacterium]
MTEKPSERREYFRITDQAIVSLNTISAEQSLAPLLNTHSSFIIRSDINALELVNQALARKIKRSDPDLSQYFDVINKKIELIASNIIRSSAEFLARKPIDINLSASGIAIQTDTEYSVGDHVSIQLLLLPEYNGIICLGQIKQINKENNSSHVAIDFTEMREADRELIIKHTMSKQLEQARNKNT